MRRMLAIAVIVLAVLAASVAQAAPLYLTAVKYWKWSPDAPHHAAMIQVRAGNRGGTGVIVHSDSGNCVVLTSYHIVERYTEVRILWPTPWNTDGIGVVAGNDVAADLSVIYQDTAGWKARAVRVATIAPKPGDRLEVCGFGGPDNKDTIRHYWVTATEQTDFGGYQYLDGKALPGDSGGAILNEDHELVGILKGGENQKNVGIRHVGMSDGSSWRIHYPIVAANLGCIRGLLQRRKVPLFPGIRQRIQQRQQIGGSPGRCPPGGCPPGGT